MENFTTTTAAVFTATTENLIFAVSKLKKVVAKNPIIPILEYIRLDHSGLTGTDLDRMLTIHIAGVPENMAPVLIPLAELDKALKACKGAEIEISGTAEAVQIKSGGRAFKFAAADPANFPTLKNQDGEICEFTAEDCRRIFKAAEFCGRDELWPQLTGVNIQAGRIAGTDAYHLYTAEISGGPAGAYATGGRGYILPANFAKVLSLKDCAAGLVANFRADNRAEFAGAVTLKNGDCVRFTYSTRLIQETYRDYMAVIPQRDNGAAVLTFGKSEILESLTAAQICSNPSTKMIRLDFTAAGAVLRAEDIDRATEFTENLPALVEFYNGAESGKIGFNSELLNDLISRTDDGTVALDYHAPNRPAVIRELDQIYLIMPMMLNEC